jgi:hypothetical protein
MPVPRFRSAPATLRSATSVRSAAWSPFATPIGLLLLALLATAPPLAAQSTRLLRQPTLSGDAIAFAYAGDLWITGLAGGGARRLTATPAVESDPHFSPDGQWLAFTSARDGVGSVYVMPAAGGEPTRVTWYPSASYVRGWTPDGERVLYATTRESAPTAHERLWTVPRAGGPSVRVPAPWAARAAYAADGRRMVIGQRRPPPHSRIQSRRISGRRSDDAESFRRRPPARFAEPRKRRQSDTSPPNPQRGVRLTALRAVKLPPTDATRSTGCIPPALCAVRFAPDLQNARVGLPCRRPQGQPASGA